MIPRHPEPFYGMEPPHDYHDPAMEMHYFGTPPLPPFPIVSTVGKGPKGDGIVMRVKVDPETGREYIEFWSTDPDVPGPLWVSPLFPKRDEDDPHGGDDPSNPEDPDIPIPPGESLVRRLTSTRIAQEYVGDLYNRWVWMGHYMRAGLKITVPYNPKFLEPDFALECARNALQIHFTGSNRLPFSLRGAAKQASDPTDVKNCIEDSLEEGEEGTLLRDNNARLGYAVRTPGAISDGGRQRTLIESYLDSLTSSQIASGRYTTPRCIAKAAGIVVPWEFPDGYPMYPMYDMSPDLLRSPHKHSNTRYHCRFGFYARIPVYKTVTFPVVWGEDIDNNNAHRYGFQGVDAFGNVLHNFSSVFIYTWAATPRTIARMQTDVAYSQKDYWSTNHGVAVSLPFGLSNGSVYAGTSAIYHGNPYATAQVYWPPEDRSEDYDGPEEQQVYQLTPWSPDRRRILFTQSINNLVQNSTPFSLSKRCTEQLARKAARVFIELSLGNGRGLWYSNWDSGEPYADPVYHDRILNPEDWRCRRNGWYISDNESDWEDYNTPDPSKNDDYINSSYPDGFVPGGDRMVDWRPDHHVNPMLRGSCFYSRNNNSEFRLFPQPRPKFLSQDDLIECLRDHGNMAKNAGIVHTMGRYLCLVGLDCSSTALLSYFSPVTLGEDGLLDPNHKSSENQFWIPSGSTGIASAGDLVTAAAPGQPLDLSNVKPGDILTTHHVFDTSTGKPKNAHDSTHGWCSHTLMIVSTPGDGRMIKPSDIGDIHYPVVETVKLEHREVKRIMYFKKLTMNDVNNKVIVMHTGGSAPAVWYKRVIDHYDENGVAVYAKDSDNNYVYDTNDGVACTMYEDANGDWQWTEEGAQWADRNALYSGGSNAVMAPMVIANNDAEHLGYTTSYRYVTRFSQSDAQEEEPYSYIYNWLISTIGKIESGEIQPYKKLTDEERLLNNSISPDNSGATDSDLGDEDNMAGEPISSDDSLDTRSLMSVSSIRPGASLRFDEPIPSLIEEPLGSHIIGFEQDREIPEPDETDLRD